MEHKFNYLWNLTDLANVKPNGCKVFSTFSCGGGSTMGYKLAGYELVGNLEIDPRKNATYVKNHHPRFNYAEDIRKFREREDLPEVLYNLDVLDGSPPCLTFSMAGSRDDKWGEVFKHDGITQRWDDLFFEYIALAKKLQPKVVVAENVKGLLLGDAKDYVRNIYSLFDEAGYYCQHWLLDASKMGVPQRRERVFFVCLRKDLAEHFLVQKDFFTQVPLIDMEFNESPITCGMCNLELGDEIKGCYREDYERIKNGEPQKYLQSSLVDIDSVHPTLTEGYSGKASPMPAWSPQWLSDSDLCKIGSFPQDYDFNGIKAHKLIGRSVPPVMMAQLSSRIYEQWLSKIVDKPSEVEEVEEVPKNVEETTVVEEKPQQESIVVDSKHKFPYDWTLANATFTKDKGNVFSCFACGGGSTMGYKLAGFDVIGDLEIDKKKNDAYVANHHPLYNFVQDIRDFKVREDLPEELFSLDVLDGSPPCKSFSMSGNRQKDWGVEIKKYGITQVWDDLFFEYIDLAKRLQPKVVVAENVKGLILGESISYVRRIYEAFDESGYYCQHFLLNSSEMGVPQRRERVFFICLRKDLATPFLQQVDLFEMRPQIDMSFNEPKIVYGEFADYEGRELLSEKRRCYWEHRTDSDNDFGSITRRLDGNERCFNYVFVKENEVPPTLPANSGKLICFDKPLTISKNEICSISSFPKDYDFKDNGWTELAGRSVPPVMMANIASRIYEQWLSKL